MTAKELLLKRVPTLSEEEAERALLALDAEPRPTIEEDRDGPAASGRLSFFAVGEGSADNASERVDELVGAIFSRRHQQRSAS